MQMYNMNDLYFLTIHCEEFEWWFSIRELPLQTVILSSGCQLVANGWVNVSCFVCPSMHVLLQPKCVSMHLTLKYISVQFFRVLTHIPPSAAYLRQWTGSSLVQVMCFRLLGAKPLPEPMLAYCQPDSWEQLSVKFESEFCHFHSRKCIWKCRLSKWRIFCPVMCWGFYCFFNIA